MTRKRKLRKAKGLHWKYRLRLAIVPFLARIGRLFGISWETLGRKLGREVLIEQVRHLKHGQVLEPADRKLDVVFLSMLGGGQHSSITIQVLLASALEARGHRVRFILCDQQFPICEVTWARQRKFRPQRCAGCYAFGRRFLGSAGFEVVLVGEMLEHLQEPSGRWPHFVEATALRYHQVGRLEDTPQVRTDLAELDRSGEFSAAIGRKLIDMRPDRVILAHGMYTTRGPARELLNEAPIPVVSISRGKTAGRQKFNWKTEGAWWDVSQEWERVRDVPLTAEQEKSIDDYLQSRRSHVRDVMVYNFGEEEAIEQTRARLRLDPDKQTFVLFTNVLWDAASAQREIAFKNPIGWVMETIAWFAEHREKQLVIKIHPAEVVIGTEQPFMSLIGERFRELPPSVRVIEPHEKVNSWSIMKVADLGLVHTSTVGIELPLEGIPCAVVSRTHFRGRGFTIDVNTRQEYFQLLENWDPASVNRDRLMTLAKRYAHLLFLRYQLPMPFVYPPTHRQVTALAVMDVKQLMSHPSVRVFIDAFENQKDFLLPAGSPAEV